VSVTIGPCQLRLITTRLISSACPSILSRSSFDIPSSGDPFPLRLPSNHLPQPTRTKQARTRMHTIAGDRANLYDFILAWSIGSVSFSILMKKPHHSETWPGWRRKNRCAAPTPRSPCNPTASRLPPGRLQTYGEFTTTPGVDENSHAVSLPPLRLPLRGFSLYVHNRGGFYVRYAMGFRHDLYVRPVVMLGKAAGQRDQKHHRQQHFERFHFDSPFHPKFVMRCAEWAFLRPGFFLSAVGTMRR